MSYKKDIKNFFYPLKENTFDKKDLKSGINVILSKKVTMSKKTLLFEKIFKNKIKVNKSTLVNSGSSANLLALQCLINPYQEKKLNRGDEILIPVICWSTSLWPIVQSGLKPVFVDVEPDTLNIDLKDLEKKITKKTKALMLVHVLGNCVDMDSLMKIIKRKKLILIEDTCESLGTKYKKRYLGTFGRFSTFSFYYSHQISSVEGGMICCNSDSDLNIIQSLRSHGWSKNTIFQKKFERLNKKLNKDFLFINSGYNLRPTDINAAIGISQFKKLDIFIKNRKYNKNKIIKTLTLDVRWQNQVKFLKENKYVSPSWFGLVMMLDKRFKSKKTKIMSNMKALGIENRPIISGNFIKQPALKKYNLIKNKKFPKADQIDNLGFMIGLSCEKISNSKLKRLNNCFFKSFKNAG
tara:strand:- start:1138 stop:2364 length:1227 start_codon:yes stop_codon:yes gene_type:complete